VISELKSVKDFDGDSAILGNLADSDGAVEVEIHQSRNVHEYIVISELKSAQASEGESANSGNLAELDGTAELDTNFLVISYGKCSRRLTLENLYQASNTGDQSTRTSVAVNVRACRGWGCTEIVFGVCAMVLVVGV